MTTLSYADFIRDESLQFAGDASDPRHPSPPVTPFDILCLAEIRRRDPDEADRLADQSRRQFEENAK